jgi:hypothetical protein
LKKKKVNQNYLSYVRENQEQYMKEEKVFLKVKKEFDKVKEQIQLLEDKIIKSKEQ